MKFRIFDSKGESLSERYPGVYIIGLTGNIATGKSLVMGMLADLGAATIDADAVAHDVILSGGPTLDAIIAQYGEAIVGEDGEINRAALGKIVFADRAQLRKLEAITHPAIGLRIEQLIRAAESQVVAIEAIKLLEGRLGGVVDAVWVVDCAPETQLRRLVDARGLSEADARQRIAGQNKQADKLRRADVIIRNDGTIEETRAQVERAWHKIE